MEIYSFKAEENAWVATPYSKVWEGGVSTPVP